LNSTRSTDFITPKSNTSKLFRNAALSLARHHPFARKLVNSGRLSVPSFITPSPLNTPDLDTFAGDMLPGAPMDDAPMQVQGKATWLLHHLGNRFQCMVYVEDVAQVDASTLSALKALQRSSISIDPLVITRQAGHIDGVTVLTDAQGLFAKRYDAKAGSTWLVRPDQHVSARWRQFDAQKVQAALQQATMAV
jgi:3-(3-hydroxy-phenyl)propionate hydroxylase